MLSDVCLPDRAQAMLQNERIDVKKIRRYVREWALGHLLFKVIFVVSVLKIEEFLIKNSARYVEARCEDLRCKSHVIMRSVIKNDASWLQWHG
jgi:hypothetical protein